MIALPNIKCVLHSKYTHENCERFGYIGMYNTHQTILYFHTRKMHSRKMKVLLSRKRMQKPTIATF